MSQKNGILSHTNAKTSKTHQEHLSHDGILLETGILYLTSKNSLRQSSHCTLVCCMYPLKGQSVDTVTEYKYLGMWWPLTFKSDVVDQLLLRLD